MYRVGIEIGVNRASLCVVDGQGSILCRRVFGAASVDHAERFTDTLCDHLEDLLLKRGLTPAEVTHVGIGVAGAVDASLRAVLSAPTVFDATPVPLAEMVEGRLGVMPTVGRDVWAAAAAELLFSAGAQAEDWVCITLGRGVGAASVRGGKVLAGGGSAPETLALSAFEQQATEAIGSVALTKRAKERFALKLPPEKPSVRDLFALAEMNDGDALQLLGEATDALADALTALMAACGVHTAVIAGSHCGYQAALIDPLLAAAKRHAHGRLAGGHAPAVRQAVFAADTTMVGAAFLSTQILRLPV